MPRYTPKLKNTRACNGTTHSMFPIMFGSLSCGMSVLKRSQQASYQAITAAAAS